MMIPANFEHRYKGYCTLSSSNLKCKCKGLGHDNSLYE